MSRPKQVLWPQARYISRQTRPVAEKFSCIDRHKTHITIWKSSKTVQNYSKCPETVKSLISEQFGNQEPKISLFGSLKGQKAR
jgi:hypothetical protein